jgi:hypothetical protein
MSRMGGLFQIVKHALPGKLNTFALTHQSEPV